MKLGIFANYLRKLGTKEGSRLIKSHGFSCLDYSLSNTDAPFYSLPEKEFENFLTEERKIIEDYKISIK